MKMHTHLGRARRLLAWGAASMTLLLAACSSGNGGGTDPGATAVTPTTTAATLAVVKPVVDCAQLAALDITDIGGAGSKIASATVTSATVNGASVSFCAVKGTLAPSNTFEVALPVSTWTQRFAALGCGGLCGNLSDPKQQNSFSFSYEATTPDWPHH